jgi:endonuclease/exonuclease/phosphatase (EEP) superfamily protein YafD
VAIRRFVGRFVRWTIRAAAVAYPLALLTVVAAFHWVGERWWVTTIGLYLPRVAFGLPLPVLVLALLFSRAFRWLPSLLVGCVILVFPLMGLHLGGPHRQTDGATRLTVLTLNMGFGHGGIAPVISLIRDTRADVVALQAVGGNFAALRAGLTEYSFVRDGELAIGSRFPLDQFVVSAPVVLDGGAQPGMYVRCRLMTPAGPVRLYSVHPTSPHSSFDRIRDAGIREEMLTGHILDGQSRLEMIANTAVRLAQLGALSEDAGTSPDPVLIAGDTNLPGLSWALSRLFGAYQDGFAEAGRGFGYTYPADRHPWMRIDRVLAASRFRFVGALTPERRIFKHLAVVADVELPPASR